MSKWSRDMACAARLLWPRREQHAEHAVVCHLPDERLEQRLSPESSPKWSGLTTLSQGISRLNRPPHTHTHTIDTTHTNTHHTLVWNSAWVLHNWGRSLRLDGGLGSPLFLFLKNGKPEPYRELGGVVSDPRRDTVKPLSLKHWSDLHQQAVYGFVL